MGKPFPLFPHAPIPPLSPKVLRGTTTEPLERLQAKLKETYPNGFEEKNLLKIGELEIPTDLESYGFFYIGAPGTGKSQTIFSNIKAILKRRNFRTIILDTNKEILAILDKICKLIKEENRGFFGSFCKTELIRIVLIRQENL